MTRYNYELGVIGGGSAGLTIASGAARLGAKTLLIEKEKRLGGESLYFGCIPSKTLIRTAQVHHLMKQAKTFGLPPVKVPPVAFKQVVRRIQSVIDAIQNQDSESRFNDLGVKIVYGQAKFINPHTVNLNGKPVSAKNWVIATGSSPAIPPLPGLADTPYLTSRDLFSLPQLPQSMIILGAGPVAIEMAQAFSRLGTQVFVVQRGPQILSKEDKDMADQVMQVLEKEGVVFFLDTSIIRIEKADQDCVAVLKIDPGQTKKMLSKVWPDGIVKIDRDRTLTLRAETLLVAMGRQANLSSLGLETIGLSFDSKGLKLDKRLRTKHPHIYGAGDVTGEYPFTHAAAYEAGIVLNNALLQLPKKVDYTWLPRCTYSDPELASLGLNENQAKKKKIKYSIWTEEFKDNDRALSLGLTSGKIKMLLDENEKPLGFQILGPGAGDLISEWVAAINGKVNLSTLAGAVHPYPTLGEINQTVARAVIARSLYSKKVKKGLPFFFELKGRAYGEKNS